MKIKRKTFFKYKGKVNDISVRNSHSYNVESLGVHNSAAGSLVAYLIGITSVDPIEYDLIFERFYNDGRNTKDHISMPDVDIDIPSEIRNKTIEYVKNKYGEDMVAQMITYQTYQGKRALKEVFRAYDVCSAEERDRITESIIDKAKIEDELKEMENPSIIRYALETFPKKFKEWCEIDNEGNLKGDYAQYFDQAIRLEGIKASQSKHAAGVVIAPEPIKNMCPMVLDTKKNMPVVGFEMEDAEGAGAIKFDLLGIRSLDKTMYSAKLVAGEIE